MGTTRHRNANLGPAWTVGLLVAALSNLPVTRAAAPDSERIAVLEQKLDESLQTIQELSARVHDLEVQVAQGAPAAANKPPSRTAAAASAAPIPSDTAQRITKVEQTLTQMAASAGQQAEGSGLPLHGFADVGIGNHNATFSQYQGANVGTLEFFLTPRLGSRTRALFELNFEVGSDGAVGVDLERAQIG